MQDYCRGVGQSRDKRASPWTSIQRQGPISIEGTYNGSRQNTREMGREQVYGNIKGIIDANNTI